MRISNLIGGKAREETFVLGSIIIAQQGIHHSDKGCDNISRAFKDGRKSIMARDKKRVMLMSFWLLVFVRLDVGSGTNAKRLPRFHTSKARSFAKVRGTNLKDAITGFISSKCD